jgi:hypothetical protein
MSQTDTKAAPAADPAAAGPEDSAASPESASSAVASTASSTAAPQKPGEIGGPRGPEPTRYGDWESKGRCTDF